MQGARMLGNYVHHLAMQKGLSIPALSQTLNCTEREVQLFLSGRAFASFQQLSDLSKILDTPIERLLAGDLPSYNASVVHCMNQFDDIQNRETILDIIDDFVDIVDATES